MCISESPWYSPFPEEPVCLAKLPRQASAFHDCSPLTSNTPSFTYVRSLHLTFSHPLWSSLQSGFSMETALFQVPSGLSFPFLPGPTGQQQAMPSTALSVSNPPFPSRTALPLGFLLLLRCISPPSRPLCSGLPRDQPCVSFLSSLHSLGCRVLLTNKLTLSLELHTCTATCLVNTWTWGTNRHFRYHMPPVTLLMFPALCSPTLLSFPILITSNRILLVA